MDTQTTDPLSLPTDTSLGLPGVVARVEGDGSRVVLTRDGQPVAAVVSTDDLRALKELDEAEDAHWDKVADAAISRWEAEGRPPGIPMEEIARDLGIDLTDTR